MADTKTKYMFLSQLWAMLVRNVYLKKRDTRKTLAEVLVPIYSLSVLILLKMAIPNPNFPEITDMRSTNVLGNRMYTANHTVAVVPSANGTMEFLDEINRVLSYDESMGQIEWIAFNTESELLEEYLMNPNSIPIAVIFNNNPMSTSEALSYTIRTNPSRTVTPSTRALYSSEALCREVPTSWPSGVMPIGENGDFCPVDQYVYSGFVSLQTIIDFTKIVMDSKNPLRPMAYPIAKFPKPAFTGNWLVIFRVIMPVYMVMTLSQFITYLLMLVVGEKEKKIREGMKIMGLRDEVYWLSWFILYGIFVFILSLVCTVLLFTLKVFQHTSYMLIFLLMLLFSFTLITFSFMMTPFFDKSRTAGILGSFVVNLMSMLYFIQVFVSNADSLAFWFVSLVSSSCFALAMDKALVMDMAGVGVTWDNIWSGPGIPFGGSLIMMAVDTVLYALIGHYLDAVIPSEYGVKRKPWFCLSPSYWWSSGRTRGARATSHFLSNGCGASDTSNPHNKDIEPVPRELQDKEAIRIVNLQKTFRHCRRSEVRAVDGIDLSIYEGQITAILGHNGAGKSTLFNILTGLTAPSFGTAYVYGLDIRDPSDMHEIRQMIGVCPQHDILFDLLTVQQHLNFFAAVKVEPQVISVMCNNRVYGEPSSLLALLAATEGGGIPRSKIPGEVKKVLQEVSLVDREHTFSKNLSGGQKRKLSVAIAIIGDPKIVILDEPTAGVDPISRRHMWRILQRLKPGKVLLLTTHFMDEADILGDRKAVISKGKLRCAGTSLFLKNKFGIGYHLTLVLDGVCREHQISRLVRAHVGRAEKARRHGRELSYILPHNAAHHFAPLFAAIEAEIDNKANRLGICSYGVSMTTLEEVFLHLEGEDEETGEPVDGLSRKLVRARALSRSLSLQSKSPSYQELHDKELGGNPHIHTNPNPNPRAGDNKGAGGLPTTSHTLHATQQGLEHIKIQNHNVPTSLDLLAENIKCTPNRWQTFRALMWIRTLRMIRDPYKLYMLIILPIVCAAFGLYVKSHDIVFFRMQALSLNAQTYLNSSLTLRLPPNHSLFLPTPTQPETLDLLGYSPSPSRDPLPHLEETLALLGYNDFRRDYSGWFPSLLDEEHLAALDVASFATSNVTLLAMYNTTCTHSMPIVVNMVNNLLYRYWMEDAGLAEQWKPIKVATHPLQQTEQAEELNLGSITCAICMGMIFAIVPVSLAVEIVYDREIKAKNQLRINGLSLSMYFLTYFCVLAVIMMVINIALLILIILNDIPTFKGPAALLVLSGLLLLYCPSSILFSTCLSYLFDKMESAQSIMPNISTWVGIIPFIIVSVLDVFKLSAPIAFHIHVFFSLMNTMYIPYAIIYYVDKVYQKCRFYTPCTETTLYMYLTPEILVMVLGMVIHIPIWSAILYVVDRRKAGAKMSQIIPLFGSKKPPAPSCSSSEAPPSEGSGEDADVRRERRRVGSLLAHPQSVPPVLLVHNLRKEYRMNDAGAACCSDSAARANRVAVARLSMAVDAGEVFGLLGHNGAGKTTTMKIITAEEVPTTGTVVLSGKDISSSGQQAFQKLGYCPQHDALWKGITVREHIECYAAIRGVPQYDIPRLTDAYMRGLTVEMHANKHSEECSGGSRRKLSFAMAMVGSPHLVLLDEPSTGMDPKSKRFLWDTILASFQGKKGAILTTHSMEEADALCSRVAIMVKGGFRCVGSTQHLKNLYGAGYTLEMKIAPPNVQMTDSTSATGAMDSASPLARSGGNSASLGEADEGELSSRNDSNCDEDTTAELADADEPALDVSIHTPLVGSFGTGRRNTPELSPPHSPPQLVEQITDCPEALAVAGVSAGLEAAQSFVLCLFPSARLEESFADRLVFSVPQQAVSSLAQCFQQLEAAKDRLRIVEYSFSQTTLEQVFLKFAQEEGSEQLFDAPEE